MVKGSWFVLLYKTFCVTYINVFLYCTDIFLFFPLITGVYIYFVCVFTDAAKTHLSLLHPHSQDLAFVYGTILTDDYTQSVDGPATNLCVFANKQVRTKYS